VLATDGEPDTEGGTGRVVRGVCGPDRAAGSTIMSGRSSSRRTKSNRTSHRSSRRRRVRCS
jgi:hypothetical protein